MIHAPVPMVAELPATPAEWERIATVGVLTLALILSLAFAVWDAWASGKRNRLTPREFLPPTRPEDKDERRD